MGIKKATTPTCDQSSIRGDEYPLQTGGRDIKDGHSEASALAQNLGSVPYLSALALELVLDTQQLTNE